jgi:NADH dehydrogenase
MPETGEANNDSGRRHRVIIGGGFGGLFAATFSRCAPVDVTLVDRTNHHLFQRLLYQLATGILSEGRSRRPYGRSCAGTRTSRFCSRMSPRSTSRAGASPPRVQSGRPIELEYDSLIVSTGATGSYFGHDEYATFAPGRRLLRHGRKVASLFGGSCLRARAR